MYLYSVSCFLYFIQSFLIYSCLCIEQYRYNSHGWWSQSSEVEREIICISDLCLVLCISTLIILNVFLLLCRAILVSWPCWMKSVLDLVPSQMKHSSTSLTLSSLSWATHTMRAEESSSQIRPSIITASGYSIMQELWVFNQQLLTKSGWILY